MTYFISASAVEYRFADGTLLFNSLDFALGPERCGLVGKNGAGKSTLLRLLAGELAPTAGAIRRHGTLAHIVDNSAGTIAELLGVARELAQFVEAPEEVEDWTLEDRAGAALELAGVAPERLHAPAATLSGGERMRVALAGCELRRPDLVLLDEPTNHLDRPAREWLYRFFERWRSGILIASHDRELLEHVAVIFEIARGKIARHGGDYDFYREAKEIESEAARQALSNAEGSLSRAKAQATRDRERQQKRNAHAATRAPSLGLPRILLGTRKRRAEVTLGKVKTKHERIVDDAQAGFTEARERVGRDENVRLDLAASEIAARKFVVEVPGFPPLVGPRKVALTGPNGSGKTTLLRKIVAGEAKLGVSRIAYLDQDLRLLDDSQTLVENVKRITGSLDETKLRARLGRVLFAGDLATKPAGLLSGGERLRATLTACLLSEPPPELLLLDEPTNHLDIASLEELERVLADYRGALIVVSHDERFLEAIGIDERWELKKA